VKKYLLGTTALAAATGFAALAVPTSADAAERLKVGVAGYFQAYYAFVDQSKDGNGQVADDRREWDLFRESEIHFTGEVALDNGMRVGVQVELESETCADQIDESYLYFQGNFGKVVVGSENSAAYLLSVGAPTVDANFDGADPNYRILQPGNNRAVATQQYAPTSTGDSEKISYFSPRFEGFQLGVSYTGDNSEEASVGQIKARGGSFAGMPSDNDPGEQQDIFEFGVNFERKFNDFGILAGATYGFGDLENNAGGQKDFDEWSAGLNVTWGGFTIGGGYYETNQGLTGNNDRTAYAAGLNYRIGPMVLGASYLHKEFEEGGGKNDILDRYMAGVRYTFHPGMEARGSVQYYDADGNTSAERNDALAIVAGVVVNF
jgi:predicted porin